MDDLVPKRRTRRPRPRNVKGAAFQFVVILGGYPVNVFYAPVLPDDSQGLFYPEEHEIYLLADSPSAVNRADRHLHEVIHGISQFLLIAEDRLTERQVNTLSTALVDTLTRNAEFRRRLVAWVTPAEEVPEVLEAH